MHLAIGARPLLSRSESIRRRVLPGGGCAMCGIGHSLVLLHRRFGRHMKDALSQLPPFDPESGDLNVVIETPRGSRNKFGWDEERQLFKLNGVLPAGAVFPYDFGFIPSTRGEDGDPLDVLLLMDEPAFPGCVVAARLLGVIEAEQTEEEDRVERNDRLIAVASTSHTHGHLQELDDLNDRLVHEIEHFFVSYNAAKGRKFQPLRRSGASRAKELVHGGERH